MITFLEMSRSRTRKKLQTFHLSSICEPINHLPLKLSKSLNFVNACHKIDVGALKKYQKSGDLSHKEKFNFKPVNTNSVVELNFFLKC